MTIKELEERTGMTRANIRYYESEGLIAPKRLDNGYRDYSEEDVNTLEKIRLLRELRLDIDAIRLVQKGSLTLEQALFNLLSRLEGEKAVLDRAAEVCRQLERSGVEYGALDPKPWLSQLEQPQQTALPPNFPRNLSGEKEKPPAPEPVDWAYYHPWMRWLARGIDVTLHGLVIDALLIFGFHWNFGAMGTVQSWVESLLSVVIVILCEPFWLHFWGWTPGKWIFGLKVRDSRGEKLSIGEGFLRMGRVFVSGYGCCIPIVNLWCGWRCWKRCRNEEDCPWDWEEGNQYTHEDRRLCGLMCAGAYVLLFVLELTMVLQGCLPPNRGDLTAEEFCENYNFYLDYLKVNSGRRLDENGQWMEVPYSGGTVYFSLSNTVCSDLELRTENGRVTAVTLADTSKSRDPDYIYMDQTCYQIATLALSGAQREINCFNYDLNSWVKLWDGFYRTGELDHRGIHISQAVEVSGYENAELNSGYIGGAIEGQEQSYSRTVTISLNGSE